jgi:chromosome segregation ATPase
MSDDKTAETNKSKSFQDRVFARFDSIDDRFERVEGQLSSVEIRITKLEERQYDTKPIWEQALAAIADTNQVMLAGFDEFGRLIKSINNSLDSMDARFDSIETRLDSMDARFDSIETRLDSMDARLDSIETRLDSMDVRFDSIETKLDSMDVNFDSLNDKIDSGSKALHTDLDNGLLGVERKIDVLNKNILDLKADQRYVDSRLEKIESQAKPS